MTHSPATGARSDQPPQDGPKVRECLKCKVTFPSKWSGERICSRCKSLNTWRNGALLRPSPSSNRR